MFVNIDVLILIYKLFSPVNSNDASRGSHLIIMSNQTLINKNKKHFKLHYNRTSLPENSLLNKLITLKTHHCSI